MFDRAGVKTEAKSQIQGNIGTLFLCTLVIGLITSVASVVSWVVAPAFGISVILIYTNLRNGIKPQVSNIFDGFSVLGKALWLTIISGFFVSLWSCLFWIPGIIKAYSYSLAPYILAENPTMTAREALSESKRLTVGAKKDLFVLDLSFIGWFFLCGITCGIASIYVLPYVQAAKVNAYQTIKQANNGAF